MALQHLQLEESKTINESSRQFEIMKEHRAPWECTCSKEDKSECKPRKKPKSDQEYFEVLAHFQII
jgi:hypothetical protein